MRCFHRPAVRISAAPSPARVRFAPSGRGDDTATGKYGGLARLFGAHGHSRAETNRPRTAAPARRRCTAHCPQHGRCGDRRSADDGQVAALHAVAQASQPAIRTGRREAGAAHDGIGHVFPWGAAGTGRGRDAARSSRCAGAVAANRSACATCRALRLRLGAAAARSACGRSAGVGIACPCRRNADVVFQPATDAGNRQAAGCRPHPAQCGGTEAGAGVRRRGFTARADDRVALA